NFALLAAVAGLIGKVVTLVVGLVMGIEASFIERGSYYKSMSERLRPCAPAPDWNFMDLAAALITVRSDRISALVSRIRDEAVFAYGSSLELFALVYVNRATAGFPFWRTGAVAAILALLGLLKHFDYAAQLCNALIVTEPESKTKPLME